MLTSQNSDIITNEILSFIIPKKKSINLRTNSDPGDLIWPSLNIILTSLDKSEFIKFLVLFSAISIAFNAYLILKKI